MRIAVLGSTRGTSMQPIIDAIARRELDASINAVISNKPDAYILERAKNHGINAIYIQPPTVDTRLPGEAERRREEFDREVMCILKEKQIDLVLLIGYMRILSQLFVNAWRGKIMNVHPSLLPAFAGLMDLAVHEAVIASGAKETGSTIHFVDEGADTGPIIIQKKCIVDPTDTPETLKARVQKLEGEACIEAIRLFASNA